MRKSIAMLLLAMFMLMCVPTRIMSVYAQGVEISDSQMHTIPSWEYTRASDTTVKEGNHLSIQYGRWTEYDLQVSKAGYYNLYITYGLVSEYSAKVGVSLNGTKVSDMTLPSTGSWSSGTLVLADCVYMNSGLNTIKVEGVSGSCYFDAVCVELSSEVNNEPEPSGIEIKTDSLNSISSWDYTRASDNVIKEGNNLSFQYSHWVEYDLDIKKAGIYNIYIKYGVPSTKVKFGISLNGASIAEKELDPTGSWSANTSVLVTSAYMTEGLNTVHVKCLNGSCYYRAIEIEFSEEIVTESFETKSITTDGGADITKNNIKVSRGCDSFNIKFSESHDEESVNNETVKLMSGIDVIPAEVSSDGETVTFKLKKTLDYQKNYSFVINGVYNEEKTVKIENDVILFTTADESVKTGSASFEDENALFDGREFEITGVMISKADMPIEGRKAEVYVTTPDGERTEKAVASGVSDKDGKVCITGLLPDNSNSGEYILELVYEYGTEGVEFNMEYEKDLTDFSVTIPSWEYSRGASKKEGPHLSFQYKDWTEYDIEVETAGYFEIYVTYGLVGAYNVKFDMSLNGEKFAVADLPPTGSYGSGTISFVDYVYMEPGINTIKVECSAGSCYFDAVGVTMLKNIKTGKLLTDSDVNILKTDAPVARGCDSFTLKFNQKLDKTTINNETIKLMCGNEEVPTEVSVIGEDVVVKLKKTLEFLKEYSFVINGVYDSYRLTHTENEIITFTTADESIKKGNSTFVVNEDVLFNGRRFEVSGVILSKAGVPIEGRIADIYVITPDGNRIEKPAASVVSKEGGKTILEGELPEGSESGIYILELKYEYGSESINIEMFYFTPEKEKELITELKNAEDAITVENFFKLNEGMLDIDISDDLAGIDSEKVYEYFVDSVPDTIKDVHKKYKESIVLEKVNQADDVNDIIVVLENEDYCNELAFVKEKSDLIVNNKTSFAEEILNLETTKDADVLSEKINSIIEKWYAEECGKSVPKLILKDKTVDIGQVIGIELAFETAIDDVVGAIFILESDDKEVLEGCKLVLAEKFSGEIKIDEKTVTVSIYAVEPQDDIISLGNINIINTLNSGEINVKLSASVIFDVGTEFEAIANSNEKTATMKIKENTQKSEGSQSSSSTGTNRGNGGNGGNSVTIPEQGNKPTDAPKENYEFSDVAENHWAKESIYNLLKKGIISESEDNKFNPERNVTRAEFVKMIVASFGLLDETAECDLKDVSKDVWYYSYVASAQKYGLITGDEKGCFNAESNITRQDMSAIIYRILLKLGYDSVAEYETFADDIDISAYAKEAVYSMRDMGILSGVGENMFMPGNFASRAQAAKIINESIKVVGI